MKKHFLSAFLCSLLCIGHGAAAQTISSKPVYKLKDNERVLLDAMTWEHGLSVNNTQYGYMFFVERNEGGESANVYAITTGNKEFGPYVRVFAQDRNPSYPVPTTTTSPTGNFCFSAYNLQDDFLVNINGKETVLGAGESTYGIAPAFGTDGSVAYSYTKGEQSFFNIGGKAMGPYSYDGYLVNYINAANYAVRYSGEEQGYMLVNGKPYGPYADLGYSVSQNSKGQFAFTYTRDSKSYINLNGKEQGPYEELYSAYVLEDGTTYYAYKKSGKWLLNINGKEYGTGEMLIFYEANQKGNFIAGYVKGNQYYVMVNGKTYGPYKSKPNEEYLNGYGSIAEDGTFGFYYTQSDEGFMLNLNGEVIDLTYASTAPTVMVKPGLAYYLTTYDYYNYELVLNGTTYYVTGFPTFSPDGKHFMASDGNNGKVIIDGKEFYNTSGFGYTFDKATNSFKWLSLAGRDVILYEVKFAN